MDHKAWLWRKKSSEKTILATNKVATPLGRIEEEVQTFSYPAEKGSETERSRKNLNEKLASVLLDRTVKEDPVPEHAKPEEKVIAGDCSEKAGESVLKQELEEPLRQGVSTNERSTHSDDAMNECMQQLKFVREEQEQRIHEVEVTIAIPELAASVNQKAGSGEMASVLRLWTAVPGRDGS